MTARQDQRCAVNEWRLSEHAHTAPLPILHTPVGARVRTWILDHGVLLYLAAMFVAFLAGCGTGKLL